MFTVSAVAVKKRLSAGWVLAPYGIHDTTRKRNDTTTAQLMEYLHANTTQNR